VPEKSPPPNVRADRLAVAFKLVTVAEVTNKFAPENVKEDTVPVVNKLVAVPYLNQRLVPEIVVPVKDTEVRVPVAFRLVAVALVTQRVVPEIVVTMSVLEVVLFNTLRLVNVPVVASISVAWTLSPVTVGAYIVAVAERSVAVRLVTHILLEVRFVIVPFVPNKFVPESVVTAILTEDIPPTDIFVGERILFALKYKNKGLPVVTVGPE
jgi:hypothetical protein